MIRDLLKQIMLDGGVSEDEAERYLNRMEPEAAALARNIHAKMVDAGDVPSETLPFAERIAPTVKPAEDPEAAKPLPPAVRAEMERLWLRLLDGKPPISEG